MSKRTMMCIVRAVLAGGGLATWAAAQASAAPRASEPPGPSATPQPAARFHAGEAARATAAAVHERVLLGGPAMLGACCFPDGSCSVLSPTDCDTAGGSYQGDDTTCDPNPCPQPTAPLILNEYNAVGADRWLDCDGAACSDASDVYFGRVQGNGGNWIELVVTQDHLDIRNWSIAWSEDVDTGTIHFTDHALWSDLRAGTIITLTELCTTEGGRNTDVTFNEVTDWWININTLCNGVAQTTYVTTTHSNAPPGSFSVGNDDFQMTIFDADANVMFGPAGEGICDFSGVGSREVGKLEEDPGPHITPCSNYQDGTSSTFGQANEWSGGEMLQDFNPLRGTLVDVELVALSAPSATDEAAALPASLAQVDKDDTFYLEIWAQTTHVDGVNSVYVTIPFNPCVVTPLSIAHTDAFSFFGGHGSIDPNGRILEVGGNHAVFCEGFGLAPNWVRVAYIECLAAAHGPVEFAGEYTGAAWCTTICGVGCVDRHRIHYGSLALQAGSETGELQIRVPGAPQVVQVGQPVTVELRAANLSADVNGTQLLLNYNPQNLMLTGTSLAPPWNQELVQDDGNGNLAYVAGIAGGSTNADGPIATLTFTTLDNGTPRVSFLPDHPPAYPSVCTSLTLAATAELLLPATSDMQDGDIVVVNTDECFINGVRYDAGDPNPDNPCELCDPLAPNVWTTAADGTPCPDGQYCNGEEFCEGGLCMPGTAVDCDDGDPCTSDSCDEENDVCINESLRVLDATVELEGLTADVTREITFVVTDCDGAVTTYVEPVAFTGGVGTASLVGLEGTEDWVQAVEGHTLSTRLPIVWGPPETCDTAVEFTGAQRLLAGDFSNPPYVPQNALVDIQDFAVLFIYWDEPVDPNLGSLADATGDGLQNNDDFLAIQANFAQTGMAADDCEAAGLALPAPRLWIGLDELGVRAPQRAARADVDGDGQVGPPDIRAFARRHNLALLPRFERRLQQLEDEMRFREPAPRDMTPR